jgi:hypothetical protein
MGQRRRCSCRAGENNSAEAGQEDVSAGRVQNVVRKGRDKPIDIYTGWGNCKRVREVEASDCLGAARMSGKVARWSTASDDIGTLRLISVRVFSSSVSVDGARRRCS